MTLFQPTPSPKTRQHAEDARRRGERSLDTGHVGVYDTDEYKDTFPIVPLPFNTNRDYRVSNCIFSLLLLHHPPGFSATQASDTPLTLARQCVLTRGSVLNGHGHSARPYALATGNSWATSARKPSSSWTKMSSAASRARL